MAAITIKSMNQKIRRVAAAFGTDSLPYKNLIADIEHNFRGQTHLTSKGVIQVTQSKTLKLNTYQEQIVNRVSRRAGVKEIKQKAKERLSKKNITKPTAEQIRENVREYTRIQEEFDKALDLVYEHEIAGDLPPDIRERYMKIYRSGKGAGMGVSEDDVQYIETKIIEYDELRTKLNELSAQVYQAANSAAIRVSEQAKIDIENVMQGEYTTEQTAAVIEHLQAYYDDILNDPETAEYILI